MFSKYCTIKTYLANYSFAIFSHKTTYKYPITRGEGIKNGNIVLDISVEMSISTNFIIFIASNECQIRLFLLLFGGI